MSKKRILIFEDSHIFADMILEFLGKEGYETDHAENGLEGIKKVYSFLPELIITDEGGNPAPEVAISIESRPEVIMAGQLDIGYTKLVGRSQPVLKHTARLTGLRPGKTYRFTAGDSARGWRGEPRSLNVIRDGPVAAFLRQVWDWMCGMLRIVQIWRVNAGGFS